MTERHKKRMKAIAMMAAVCLASSLAQGGAEAQEPGSSETLKETSHLLAFGSRVNTRDLDQTTGNGIRDGGNTDSSGSVQLRINMTSSSSNQESAAAAAAAAAASNKSRLPSSANGLCHGVKRVNSNSQTAINDNNNSNNGGDNNKMRASISTEDLMLQGITKAYEIRAYPMDIHSYRDSARFEGDASHLDSHNPDHIKRCGRHLSYYASLLKEANEATISQLISRQAIVLSDSYGRPESGVRSGNAFWLGSYQQCQDEANAIKVPLQEDKDEVGSNDVDDDDSEQVFELVENQYCIMSVQGPNWNKRDTLNTIRLGVCLPSTCTNSMLEDYYRQQVLTMGQTHLSSAGGPYRELKPTGVYCLPHASSPVRQLSHSAWGFLGVLGAFLVASIVGTLWDSVPKSCPDSPIYQTTTSDGKMEEITGERNWKTILVEGFSLSRNYQKIVNIKRDNGQHFLDSLAGIKCISLCWIIAAHSFLLGFLAVNNMVYSNRLTQTWLANVYLTAHLVVDGFFAISGLLASYCVFKATNVELMTPLRWLLLTIHRYWRLTPLYLLAYWYAKSVGHVASSGPFWDYMTSAASPRLQCSRESWWVALLHWSDFKSPKDHCVPFAWFIANGIKFWIVTPVFLTMIARDRFRGYLFTSLALLANMALVLTLSLRSTVDVEAVLKFKAESADNMLNEMGEVYSRPYSRIGAYLVGLLAGHLIYLVEKGELQVRMGPMLKKFVWALVTVTLILLTFIMKLAPEVPKQHQVYLFAVSSTLIRPLWAACICWLVFSLSIGQASWLRRFLSAGPWQILVRISYSAYLVQGEILGWYSMGHNGTFSMRYSDLMTMALMLITITFICSFLTTILIELPLTAIEEILLPKKPKSQDLVSSSNHQQQQQQTTGQAKEFNCSTSEANCATNCHLSASGHSTKEKVF